jgi:hypothetical protein
LYSQGGYVLAPFVRIDLESAERTLQLSRVGGELSEQQWPALETAADCDLDEVVSRSQSWEWFTRYLPQIEAVVREAAIVLAEKAIRTSDIATAARYARELLARERDDIAAQELLRICSGRTAGAR